MAETYWTEDRVELLKKLFNDGLSSTVAAKHFPGQTRNGVIGKWTRLGLKRGKEKPTTTIKEPRPRVVRRSSFRSYCPAKPGVIPTIPVAPEIIGPHQPVTFSDLADHQCKAVLDKRGDDGLFMRCGRERVRIDNSFISAYCAFHDRLFNRPPPPPPSHPKKERHHG